MVELVSISQALLVAEHLSFSRAAQVLGIQQSVVSRRMRALEDKLGISLIERDASGVRLTEAGRRFLDRSRSALAEIDPAVKAAANAGCGADGAIRIGVLSGGFVRELLISGTALLSNVTASAARP
jgi:DNA-binding transcriptional LysR family regulator